MEKMLTEVCDYLNNYFWRQKIAGKFTIEEGSIVIPQLKEGQYFRIVNSIFNDGVHQYPVSDLTDEEFEGEIWSMAVPQTVVDLASDIADWQSEYGSAKSEAMSPYTSESFGNYSYSKSAGGAGGTGSASSGWQGVFANRLNKWRRLRNMP